MACLRPENGLYILLLFNLPESLEKAEQYIPQEESEH